MEQIVQVIGALFILSGFALLQARLLSPDSLPYLLLNLIGAGILTVLAYQDRQWGFLLLEGVWTLVSLVALLRLLWVRARREGGGPPPITSSTH